MTTVAERLYALSEYERNEYTVLGTILYTLRGNGNEPFQIWLHKRRRELEQKNDTHIVYERLRNSVCC